MPPIFLFLTKHKNPSRFNFNNILTKTMNRTGWVMKRNVTCKQQWLPCAERPGRYIYIFYLGRNNCMCCCLCRLLANSSSIMCLLSQWDDSVCTYYLWIVCCCFLDVNYFSDTDKQQALPALIKIKVIHLHWYTFEEYSLWYSSMVSFFEIFIFNYSRGV